MLKAHRLCVLLNSRLGSSNEDERVRHIWGLGLDIPCFGLGPPFVMGVGRLRAGEVPRGEKMPSSGADPESYVTEYTLVNEEPLN